jgi:hypothetical protein
MIEQEKLLEIEIKDFITKIQLSKARKEIYYEFNLNKSIVPMSKLRHTGKGKNKYKWETHKIGSKHKILLTDVSTGKPVIKNSKAAGTPKFLHIKGNSIYSGFGGYRTRVQIMHGIKNNFREFFKDKKINDFPIYLKFIMYDKINLTNGTGKTKSQDGDNCLWPYTKATQDLMVEMKIIPDDNLSYIRKSSWEFIDSEEKKLVIIAYKYENKG